jgi:hypothetical protein
MERSNPFFAAPSLPFNAKLPLILLAKFAAAHSLCHASRTAAKSSIIHLYTPSFSKWWKPRHPCGVKQGGLLYMKKTVLIVVGIAFLLILSGCLTYSTEYLDKNIKIATHPMEVQGLTAVAGEAFSIGSAWSLQEIGQQVANSLARNGGNDVTVFIELVQQGQVNFSGYGPSSKTVARYTVYR